MAEHTPGQIITAEGRGDLIDRQGRRRVVERVRRWWPGLDPEPTAAYTCLFTRTPDDGFIVDRADPIVDCSSCSGHGAKFAALIGEWVADLVEGRKLPYPCFSLSRRL